MYSLKKKKKKPNLSPHPTNHPPISRKIEQKALRSFCRVRRVVVFSFFFLSREFARNFIGRGVLSFPFTGLTRELKVLPWLQGRCHGLESAKRRKREDTVPLLVYPPSLSAPFSFSHACIDPTGCRM